MSRLLPGEEGGSTVFEIQFWDGCCISYTAALTVLERVDELVASSFAERQSTFDVEHCARMGSVVRVVASSLEMVVAAELRNELVRIAPEGMRKVDEASPERPECVPAEVPAEPVSTTFGEWVKTRDKDESEGQR